MTRTSRRTALLAGYAILAAADTLLAANGNGGRRRATKPTLMPVLAAAALADNHGSRQADPAVIAGLGLSWLGDIALLGEGEAPFAAGLGSFLAAHCCYLVALRRRPTGALRRRAAIAGIYGLAWSALNAVLWPRTGRLRLPVIVYGSTLSAMALAALDVQSPLTAAGGAAFLVSDSLLALDTFGVVDLPAPDSMVMATYTTAQALLALG